MYGVALDDVRLMMFVEGVLCVAQHISGTTNCVCAMLSACVLHNAPTYGGNEQQNLVRISNNLHTHHEQ